MDEPVRHMNIDAAAVRRARKLTPAESLSLAAGLTDAAIELSRAGGAGGARFWRPTRSTKS
jgi:hypothetical protein